MVAELIYGDCLEYLPDIPDNSIDMILCDLPYGVLNRGNDSAQWDYPLDMSKLWAEYERIIKSNGAIVLFGQGMFTAECMIAGKRLWRYNLIWHKTDRPTGFLNAKKMLLRDHEDLMIFYKSLPTYNPQMVYAGPDKRNHSKGKQTSDQTNRCYGDYGKAEVVFSDYKYPRSVLDFPKEKNVLHPTQKPVALCEWLIKTYSDEGDIILDNCMGTGTTGVACKNLNRNFIGMENNPEYFEIAKKRIEE